MATARLDKNQHPNTLEENEKILKKLRTRVRIDDRSGDELNKLFAKLNANIPPKSSSLIQSPSATRQDQLVTSSYGPIVGFPSGSWWGIRMDCSRDQVHVPFNRDIDEGPFGAVSICTSHVNQTNDVDLGDFLTFTGTEYDEETSCPDALAHSHKNHIPMRLVRGYDLSNKFAPKTGYRYDGLYIIISSWIGVSKNSRKNYKFALARLNDQEPPPWRSSPALIESKKTRNKSKLTQRCHMDCCKTKLSKDKKIDNMPIEKLTITSSLIKSPKQIKECSTIVLRHVSKKFESVPGIESPILNYSPKQSTCKLQNTNISIRTDLYDSSPNHQQDIKKTPMTFCRIYKSIKPIIKSIGGNSVAPQTAPNPSAVGGVKDKSQINESQIKIRSAVINKNRESSPLCTSTKNPSTPRKNSSTSESPNFPKTEFSNTESKDRDKNVIMSKELVENVEKVEGSISASRRGPASPLEETMKEQEEAVAELESMSPEQMVNLIVKERYKRSGKLLIGNIIGDPGFMSPSQAKKDLVPEKPPAKVIGPAKTKKTDLKVEKKSMRTLYSLRSNSAAKKGGNEGKDRKKKKEESKRKETSKIQTSAKIKKKPFSNVAKKRRSELAKLAIDANFVTKTRGPRTRRFPYAIRGFSKRRDTLRHLKGRSKVDLSKKTTLIKRNTAKESSTSTRIPQIHSQPMKKSENVEHVSRDVKRKAPSEISNKSDKSDESSEVIDKGVQRTPEKKSRMVDAMVQCTLQKDASTSVDFETISRNERDPGMRIKWVNVDDVKSETEESDDESLQEIYYRNSSVQTTQEAEIIRPNCVKRSLEASARLASELSAFAPVNMSDVEFRVARLRSIGFKPIDPCVIYTSYQSHSFNDYRQSEQSSKGSNISSVANVVRRDVNEQYVKYTSEENNVVGYMDDELRFQDIEDEEIGSSSQVFGGLRRRKSGKREAASGNEKIMRKKRKNNDSSAAVVVVDDEPWHGWKKFVQL